MGNLHCLACRTPTAAELVIFLESRCRALELLQTTQSLKSTAITPRSPESAGAKVSKPIYCNVATQLQCSLCDESHRFFKYDRFLKLQPRQHANYAKQLGLCFNCLQPFFKGHTCSRKMCHKCNKRHHTLLHMDRKNQMVYNKGSTSNKNLPAETRAPQLQRATPIGHTKANPEITCYLQQLLLRCRINLVNMYHAGPC